MIRRALVLVALCGALLAAAPAFAHGLLMKLRSEGGALVGELYYSNGTRAAQEWVEVTDLDGSGSPAQFRTGPQGGFRHPAIAGHRYSVKAFGEEGHEITMAITAGEARRGTMQDEAVAGKGEAGIPAWALVGGVLLLSVAPALWFRRRDRRASPERG
ncbi:MAG TPA: hypothetical protein VMQ93_08815 [Novosphingobium sp.]|nr:hypothetical protein [Novosphingobium sp.]